MKRAGQQSNVLNIDPQAPRSDAYIKISGAVDLGRELVRHVSNDWVLNVHTNGHNAKSWAIALVCGLAAQFGPGASLTLHSGLAPAYVRTSPAWRRQLIRLACVFYSQLVCVNDEIAAAVADLGVAKDQIRITPAFLPVQVDDVAIPPEIGDWLSRHSPVLTSAMFFRPEYGFELLVPAMARLKAAHPRAGCLVMGIGQDCEQAAALVAKHGLADAMFLAGDLHHDLCLALMARSAVFVRPTLRDGDSISVREALSLGAQVVASNVGTRPEGVLLFEPGDADGLVRRLREAVDTGRLPSLEKEGWPRHQENVSVPSQPADGVVRSTSDNRWLEPITPPVLRDASRHFVNGRSHPSFAKEGNSGKTHD
jgi:glycogen synthase